ncbi:AraC family transcriptional regulator [Paenibacillus sp. 7124]|uniref:AraC family transcriptional regulator n=1 Tax=Paenibacillus apii TaxID=1850370 RepID=A0A6M1PQZ7_9BACL|nr:AraC family transcriptional regulator [Paenibacillus apii]NGM84938.1 AraC family transcriptional regulator [Paenibacillus apii]NJJ41711.1 AraC family transcriptional regulator [Paenibacillus apii]
MATHGHRRIIFAPEAGSRLPIALDSIGYNPEQERVSRPDGYPAYHWLQTAEGQGLILFGEQRMFLPRGSGVLLPPRLPHRYEAVRDGWRTYYLTFAGGSADSILLSLGLSGPSFHQWEDDAPVGNMVEALLNLQEKEADPFGQNASAGAYRFLLALSSCGSADDRRSISGNLGKLQPLLAWMEESYGNPDIGLNDLSGRIGVSGRYLNSLFLHTFGLSPYAYFIRLRIRKSKELLIGLPEASVKSIAQRVGFRDASHFVATFRKLSGTTPEQFRSLH